MVPVINSQKNTLSYIAADDKVILFDGVCRLCNGWAKFIIRFDKAHHFKLATVQSKEGQEILAYYGLATDHYETMVLLDQHKIYTQSTAFIRVMVKLPWYWKPMATAWIIPSRIRNWLYDRIALNRYQFFGKFDVCLLPTPDHKK